jgi:hypothetical protein
LIIRFFEKSDVEIGAFMIDSLKSYFQEIKTYLWSQEIIQDLNSEAVYSYSVTYESIDISIDQRKKNLKEIQDNFEILETNFNQKIERLEKAEKFNSIPFCEIFYFLNSISGLVPLKVILSRNHFRSAVCEVSGSSFDKKFGRSLYPLPNKTGLFDLEYYLKCLFEKKLLVGIPIRPLRFDGEYSSASVFMTHDIAHNFRIFYDFFESDSFEILKEFFYKILDLPQKDILVLFIWSLIHEFNNISLKSWTDLSPFPLGVAYEFKDLLKKNKELFWNEETLKDISLINDQKIKHFFRDYVSELFVRDLSEDDTAILFLAFVIYSNKFLN